MSANCSESCSSLKKLALSTYDKPLREFDPSTPSNPLVNHLGEKKLIADYEAGVEFQHIIALIKQPNRTKNQTLSAPWREKSPTFSFDTKRYLYMDDQLVVAALRTAFQRSLHWGYPDLDR